MNGKQNSMNTSLSNFAQQMMKQNSNNRNTDKYNKLEVIDENGDVSKSNQIN